MCAFSSGESCGLGCGIKRSGWMRGRASLGLALMVLGLPVLTASAREAATQHNITH